MIYITKNTENVITLELTGISNILNSYYLFEIVDENNVDKENRYFTTPNTSIAKDRYDEFLFIDADNGSDTNGDEIPMNWNIGQFIYNIYRSSTVIDIDNLTPILNKGIISTGRMIVDGIDTLVDPVYDSNIPDETTNDVYH